MLNRANQLRIEDEDEQEDYLENRMSQEQIETYDLEYPDERHFPALMLSYIGPQHGRYFYACMDKDTLVIRQSELFDFRKLNIAHFDKFTELLLSQPEERVEERCVTELASQRLLGCRSLCTELSRRKRASIIALLRTICRPFLLGCHLHSLQTRHHGQPYSVDIFAKRSKRPKRHTDTASYQRSERYYRAARWLTLVYYR
jgi:hypothetical protein